MSLIHYKSTFLSDAGDPFTIYIRHKTDNTGTEELFKTDSKGFVLKYAPGKFLRLAGMMPSSVAINVQIENDAQKVFFHNMSLDPPDTWYIRIHRSDDIPNSTIYWAAWIDQSFAKFENMPFPYQFNVKASDSLLRLKRDKAKEETLSSIDSYVSLLHPLQIIHDLYDHDLLFGALNYKYSMSFDWWNVNTQYAAGTNPLAKTFYNRAAFIGDQDNGPLTIKSLYVEIEAVLKVIGCKLFLSNGYYHIQQDNGLDSAGINTHLLMAPDQLGTQVSYTDGVNAIPIDNSLEISNTNLNIYRGSKYSYKPQLNGVKIKYLYGVGSSGFTPTENYSNLTNIGYVDEGAVMSLSLNLEYSEQFLSSAVTPNSMQGSYMTGFFAFTIKVGNYYLKSDNGTQYEWTTDPTSTFGQRVGIGCSLNNSSVGDWFASQGLSLVTIYDEDSPAGYDTATIKSFFHSPALPPAPVDGHVEFKFDAQIIFWQLWTDGSIQFQNIPTSQGMSSGTGLGFNHVPFSTSQNINFLPFGCNLDTAEAGEIGMTLLVTQDPVINSIDADLGDVMLGGTSTISSLTSINSLMYFDGTDYLPAGGFRRSTTGNYSGITGLLATEYLQGQTDVISTIQGKIRGRRIYPSNTIIYDDFLVGTDYKWIFVNGNYTASLDEWSGVWYQLKLNSLTPVIEQEDNIGVVTTDLMFDFMDDKFDNSGEHLAPNGHLMEVKHKTGLVGADPIVLNVLNDLNVAILTTKVDQSVGVGKIFCTALKADLAVGQRIALCNTDGGEVTEMTVSTAAARNDVDFDISTLVSNFTYETGAYIVLRTYGLISSAPAAPNLALGVTTTKIYIKPDQFKTWTSSSIQSYTRDTLGSVQPSAYASRTKVFASTFVPAGYKVTGFQVFSSQNRAIQALSSRVSSDNIGSLGTGTANTFQLITAWNSVNGDYFILTYEIGASTDEIYGAELDIALI